MDQAPKPRHTALRLLGEFAIIFAGVTLGLLADDWRQTRDDQATERVVLQDLSEDLVRDSIQLNAALRTVRLWDRAALWVRRADPATVTAEDAAGEIGNAMTLTFYKPVSSAYSSLNGSGQLELIQDPELRRQIVEYFEEHQPTMSEMATLGQSSFLAMESAFWPYFVSPVADDATSLFPGTGTVGRPSWRDFWDDPQALQALDELGKIGSIWGFVMPATFGANSDLRARIADALER